MTKKDYVAIAAVIRDVRTGPIAAKNTAARLVLHRVALEVSAVCAADNDRFDEDRFLQACGVEQ